MRDILANGETRRDRTGTGTISLFGQHLTVDCQKGKVFPTITTRKVYHRAVINDMLWMLSGSTNIKTLQDQGHHHWDAWADEQGNLGPSYGHQLRNFNGSTGSDKYTWRDTLGIDQVSRALRLIKEDPRSRRILITLWNPSEISHSNVLPPCLTVLQFYVRSSRFLDVHIYQRSCDVFIGFAFDFPGFSLLLYLISHFSKLIPGRVHWSCGDSHVYLNHVDQVREQLRRVALVPPQLIINSDKKDLFDVTSSDLTVVGYKSHPPIKGDVSI